MKLCHTATIIAALAWALPAVAQKTNADRTNSATIAATAALMAKEHIKKTKIDKPFREQWLKQYLEVLDPSKLSRTLFKPVCISGLHISLFETTKVAFVIERFRNRAHHALLYDRSIMLDQPA